MGIRRKLGKKRYHLRGPRQIVGQYEMPDEQSPPGHASFVQDEVAYLPVHLVEGCASPLRIVHHTGIALCRLGIGILEIRQVKIE